MKNFVDIKDFTAEEINALLNSAVENKNHNLSSEEISVSYTHLTLPTKA